MTPVARQINHQVYPVTHCHLRRGKPAKVLSAGAHPIQTANVLLNKAVHFHQRPGQTISRTHSDFSTLLPDDK